MGLIETPTMIAAAGNPPKRIAEYVGRLNTGSAAVSIARMVSPGGWQEPGQTPEFDEYTLVLRGSVRVETRTGVTHVTAGQAFFASKGEWVSYATPEESGAEYIAICVPAFSPEADAVIGFRADPELQARIEELARKSTEGELTEDERAEYAGYVRANKFVAILKRQAQHLANSQS